MNVEIRAAVESDWPVLRQLRLRALEDAPNAFGQTLGEALRARNETWRSWAAGVEGQARVLLAIDAGAAVGMLSCRFGPERAGLGALWVDPAFRSHGLGERLLREGEAWLASLGATQLQLSVTDGSPAERLYRRLGYERTGETAPMREDGSLVEVKMARSTG